MKIYCGTDIVEISRIRKALEETQGFRERIYTSGEIAYCESKKQQKYRSYAARFSAKEAVVKALGTGFGAGMRPMDIEILNDDNNKPYITLHGAASGEFAKRNITLYDISMSHCDEYAVACFIAMGKGEENE